MKKKFLFSLGSISALASMPLMAVACKSEVKEVSLKATLLRNDETKAGTKASHESDSNLIKYESFDVDMSSFAFVLVKPDFKTADLIAPKKDGQAHSIFFTDYQGANTFHGKKEENQKLWEGVLIARVENLPAGYTLANENNPTYRGKDKKYTNNSGFINVTLKDGTYTFNFRLFRKFSKEDQTQPAVSTQVYTVSYKT
ncbi:variable surface lipoprotein [Mycoplasma simbae]|uniref:variable surface lipoprotein n=1 Tax=Mycoplasma simbae TaxID=36744 RepID=UPI000689358E|nr:variable surface lipoprotein [Mycoplasma simbae]